ncbi:MAG: DegT/DnrJ/EryC1/StrS family aminotransferase [Velocimicrobium sp.]
MMQIPFMDVKAQYHTIEDEIKHAILDVLNSGEYILGEQVKRFEEEFATYNKVSYAVAVGNGTEALIIALKALGIGPGDEIITTPSTFYATTESILQVGAVPVYVDINMDTYLLDETKIESCITDKTKAILPVHLYGQCANMEAILAIAKKYQLKVIEDSCQAVGAEFKGKKAGSMGDIGCFSFFPTKNLGCAGDGGMIVTNNKELATVCKSLRAHCSGINGYEAYHIMKPNHLEEIQKPPQNISKYNHYGVCYNSRLDELQAAILRVKLPHLEEWNGLRREHAAYYCERLLGVKTPIEAKDCYHTYHLFILRVNNQAYYINYLKKKGIQSGVYYPVPMHLQTVCNFEKKDHQILKNAEILASKSIAIPVYPELSKEELDYIIGAILEANHGY